MQLAFLVDALLASIRSDYTCYIRALYVRHTKPYTGQITGLSFFQLLDGKGFPLSVSLPQ